MADNLAKTASLTRGKRMRPHLTRVLWIGLMIVSAVVTGEENASVTTDKTVSSDHPLKPILAIATKNAEHIAATVNDYSCRLVKRERIDGELQEYQFMMIQMRRAQTEPEPKPMAVFVRYLAPALLRDRRLLFIDGENDNKVLVRKGGRSLDYLQLQIDPNGIMARRESRYPINEIGFDQIIKRLIELIREDIQADPNGDNTVVEVFKDAKIKNRICTHYRVTHPRPSDELTYYQASLYLDDEQRVPVRVRVIDWPQNFDPDASSDEKQPAVLLEEYTYIDLKLNVGLDDDTFDPARLVDPDDPKRNRDKTNEEKS
ncbi:MAG: DUF1571 domain-containing protein [Planctomycetota bacterium]